MRATAEVEREIELKPSDPPPAALPRLSVAGLSRGASVTPPRTEDSSSWRTTSAHSWRTPALSAARDDEDNERAIEADIAVPPQPIASTSSVDVSATDSVGSGSPTNALSSYAPSPQSTLFPEGSQHSPCRALYAGSDGLSWRTASACVQSSSLSLCHTRPTRAEATEQRKEGCCFGAHGELSGGTDRPRGSRAGGEGPGHVEPRVSGQAVGTLRARHVGGPRRDHIVPLCLPS